MHPSGTKPSERPEKNLIKENGMKEKAEKTKRYFMQLNTKQRNDIYNMYKIDFEMFDYSPVPYHPEEFM